MAILILDATSKPSRELIKLLQNAKVEYLCASPWTTELLSPDIPSVKLNYRDRKTFSAPFEFATSEGKVLDIGAVFVPQVSNDYFDDRQGLECEFLKFAYDVHGVSRFVILARCNGWYYPDRSKSGLPNVSDNIGRFLVGTGVDYTLIRSETYMEDILDKVSLACTRGDSELKLWWTPYRKPLVSVKDAARIAERALCNKTALQKEIVLTGSEAVTLDDVAEMLKDTGCKVTLDGALRYRPMSYEMKMMSQCGWSPENLEATSTEVLSKIAGCRSTKFEDAVKEHKSTWNNKEIEEQGKKAGWSRKRLV